MILMAVAIVCGLGASIMTSRLLAERGDTQEIAKVAVAVAKRDLSIGSKVKKAEDFFELKEFTKGEEPKDAFTMIDHLKGKFLKRNLRKGDFVTLADIDDNQQSLQIPEGKQAVGIRVNNESIAGGWASLPGNRVDISCTIRGGNGLAAQCVTLLENVLVLAADGTKDRDGDKNNIMAQVVIVALSTEDVQKINLAKSQGDLSLSLRRNDDETKTKNPAMTLDDLIKSLKKDHDNSVAQAQPATQPAPQPEPKVEPKVEPKPAVTTPAPKVVKALPKFEKHVILVREGKSQFNRIFWFDEKGQPVPEETVKRFYGDGDPVPEVEKSAPEQPATSPNSSSPQSPAVNPAPGASGPVTKPRPESEKKEPESKKDA